MDPYDFVSYLKKSSDTVHDALKDGFCSIAPDMKELDGRMAGARHITIRLSKIAAEDVLKTVEGEAYDLKYRGGIRISAKTQCVIFGKKPRPISMKNRHGDFNKKNKEKQRNMFCQDNKTENERIIEDYRNNPRFDYLLVAQPQLHDEHNIIIQPVRFAVIDKERFSQCKFRISGDQIIVTIFDGQWNYLSEGKYYPDYIRDTNVLHHVYHDSFNAMSNALVKVPCSVKSIIPETMF
jgi:hypothetical protein